MVFTAPLFLIGLVAVAIPVIVHLFNFRRYRKIYFSNVERLEQLKSETQRQSTLRQLLIMAARILAVAFIVLAFARPVLTGTSQEVKTGINDVSIYIDNSYSMEGTDGNVALIEKAKSKAREIVDAYGAGDRFQLMTSDVEGREFHWLSKEEVLSRIDEVEAGSSTLTVSSAVRRQQDFLSSGNGNRYAYVISDFQVSTTDIAEMRVDSAVSLTLVPLESASRSNVYVDSVSLNAPVFGKGSAVVAEVWMCNDGDEDLEKVPVSLYINERQRALSAVDMPARGRVKVEMHFVVDETGIMDGRVETNDYPVTFDDRYYFSINVREQTRGLVVEGGAGNAFLARLFDGDSAVKTVTVSSREMDFSRIDGNEFIIVDELETLTTGMAQSLHTFAERGGTVVVVVADNADEKSYNEALALFDAPRLAGRVRGRVASASLNMDNELYRNVFDGRNRDIELPSVTDYHRMVWSASTLREPLITLVNGDDYITVTKCGRGRLYLIAAPLRDEHTDFVRQALFVPTLYNMALYSVPPSALQVTFGQEAPLLMTGDYSSAEGTVRMRKTSPKDADYEEIPDIRQVGGGCMLFVQGAMDGAGNYRVDVDGEPQEGVSFNYSRLESQMQFLGSDGLQKMLEDYNLKQCGVVRNAEKPLDTYIKEQNNGRGLWRWCLLIGLLMLAAEVALVRIKGKG